MAGGARRTSPPSADSLAVLVEAVQMRLARRHENGAARREGRLARQTNGERADRFRVGVHERVGAQMLDDADLRRPLARGGGKIDVLGPNAQRRRAAPPTGR